MLCLSGNQPKTGAKTAKFCEKGEFRAKDWLECDLNHLFEGERGENFSNFYPNRPIIN